ncbi:MAG: hypothetical protein ACKPKO_33560 [Candidatus Fonsibacter sp.]
MDLWKLKILDGGGGKYNMVGPTGGKVDMTGVNDWPRWWGN